MRTSPLALGGWVECRGSCFTSELAELDVELKEALRDTQLDDIIDLVNVQEGLARLSELSSMLLHHHVFVSPPLLPGQRQMVNDAVDAAIIVTYKKQATLAWPAGVPTQLPFQLLPKAVRISTKWLAERMYDLHAQPLSDDMSSFILHAFCS